MKAAPPHEVGGRWRRSVIVPLLAPLLLVALLLGFLLYCDSEQLVRDLFAWLGGLGVWAPIAFVVLDILVVILLLPGIVLTVGAGFLFGLVEGSVLVVIAATLGGSIAFLSARYLFGARATAFLEHHAKLHALSEEFNRDAWKFVMLTRLVPFFPFKLSNYFFGVTPFPFLHYFVGTLIGIVPNTVFLVYLGSLTADVALLDEVAMANTPAHWVAYGGGLIATVAAVVIIARRARHALNRYLRPI